MFTRREMVRRGIYLGAAALVVPALPVTVRANHPLDRPHCGGPRIPFHHVTVSVWAVRRPSAHTFPIMVLNHTRFRATCARQTSIPVKIFRMGTRNFVESIQTGISDISYNLKVYSRFKKRIPPYSVRIVRCESGAQLRNAII